MLRLLAVFVFGVCASLCAAAEDVAEKDFWREVDRWEWDSSRLSPSDALRKREPATRRLVEEHGKKLVPICEAALGEEDPSPGQKFFAFVTLIHLIPDETAHKLVARRLTAAERPERWLEEDAICLLPLDKFTRLLVPLVADRQVSLDARRALYPLLAAGGDKSAEATLRGFQEELEEIKTPERRLQAKVAELDFSHWRIRHNAAATFRPDRAREQAFRFHRLVRMGRPKKDDEYLSRAMGWRDPEGFDSSFLQGEWVRIEDPEFEVRAKTALAIGAAEGARYAPATLERLAANPAHERFAIYGLMVHHSEEAAESLRKLVDPKKPQEWAGTAVEIMGGNGGPEMIEQIEKWQADAECKLPRESLTKARDELRQRYKR